jgi:hypothetical protein
MSFLGGSIYLTSIILFNSMGLNYSIGGTVDLCLKKPDFYLRLREYVGGNYLALISGYGDHLPNNLAFLSICG